MTDRNDSHSDHAGLRTCADVLMDEAFDPYGLAGVSFYDELKSFQNSIDYGDSRFYDLGHIASFLSVVNAEISEKDYDKDKRKA